MPDAFNVLREHAERVALDREEAELAAVPVDHQPAESTLRPSGGSVAAIGAMPARSLTRNANADTEACKAHYVDDWSATVAIAIAASRGEALVISVPSLSRASENWVDWVLPQDDIQIDLTVSRESADRLSDAARAGKLWLVAEVAP